MDKFSSELLKYIQTGTSVILVSTREPYRAYDSIIEVALDKYKSVLSDDDEDLDVQIYGWRNTLGWNRYLETVTASDTYITVDDDIEGSLSQGDTPDPMEVVEQINNHEGSSINILMNFHWYLGAEAEVRLIQQFLDNINSWGSSENSRTVILIAPSFDVHPELRNMIHHIPFTLPSKEELSSLINAYTVHPKVEKVNNQEMVDIIDAGSGLTLMEFEKALTYSLASTKGVIDPKIIMEEKVKEINKTELLTYFAPDTDMSEIGGLDIMKDWLLKRKVALSAKAREYGLPYPKGMLLLGVPGSGKTVTVKSLGSSWNLPLIRLDLGKLFGSLVGESERMTREVQDMIEALAPCIVWIDEAEKGFGGTRGGGSSDGGTTQRVFGSWLTWLSERPKDKLIYVAMTVNDVSQLPPELMRKGRFDEIFWLDVPDEVAREEIFRIHLNKRGKLTEENEEALFDLVKASKNFVGAEIENVIESAMFNSFYDDVELSPNYLLEEIKEVTPLAEMQKDYIEAVRNRYENVIRSASSNKGKLSDPTNIKAKVSTKKVTFI